MAVTRKRLWGPAAVATGPATVYTTPASTKTIIRQIIVNNPSASAVTLTLSIGADAAGTRILDAFTIPAKLAGDPSSFRILYVFIVLEAAEVLQMAAGTNNILVTVGTGEENTLG